MSKTRESADKFWRWFESHRSDLDALVDTDDPLWDVVLGQLQQIHKRLRFELSMPNGSTRDFVVTADGHEDAFPLADALVARSPSIHGWRFIALKPPMGFDFVTNYEGVSFDPHSMGFMPLESGSRPQDLGLRIGVPNLTGAIMQQAENAILIILDTALGERAAAIDIQHLEVSNLPESPESHGYIELHMLPKYIEWRKQKRRKAR